MVWMQIPGTFTFSLRGFARRCENKTLGHGRLQIRDRMLEPIRHGEYFVSLQLMCCGSCLTSR
jgi:hypothetical protein